jgi:competence protein ComEA
MKQVFRDFFSFSSMERKGILVLIMLMLTCAAINLYLVHKMPKTGDEDDSLFENDIRTFTQQLTNEKETVKYEEDLIEEYPPLYSGLFDFDPNTVTAGELKQLGFSNRVIRTLLNYRIHGGRFSKAEDLKKIYGMNLQLYAKLESYVKIRENSYGESQVMPAYKSVVRIDINLADSSDLEKLPGIGPVLARRIVRYRSLLGGFYEINQLTEVYGISDSLCRMVNIHIFADSTLIRKLNLNEASEKELASHPYIGKYAAKGIVSYRLKVHIIKEIHELVENGLISTADMEKLKNYLLI